MKLRNTPRFANWMLEHLTMGGSDEALAGDLAEEFRRGRSRGWYWRQVLIAIVIGFLRQLRTHWLAGAFAALWVWIGAGNWFRLLEKIDRREDFTGSIWKLPWPYSTMCSLATGIASVLLFIWAGSALYLLVYSIVFKRSRIQGAPRCLLISAIVCLVAFIAMVVPFFVFVGTHGVPSLAYLRLMTDLPLFLGLLAFLLLVLPSSRKSARALP